MDGWDGQLRTFLFTSGDLTALEEGGDNAESSAAGRSDLSIGKL
jgi:hypothetical protein